MDGHAADQLAQSGGQTGSANISGGGLMAPVGIKSHPRVNVFAARLNKKGVPVLRWRELPFKQ